ncbi:thiol reductant ABC exporter subunit CydD [Sinisalibacter lacisalsi]|uniref:Thiol reductant ABC exporter subunit CydD n=1 Tax=Sinisalibacter lacisalsi TaxID=1526570 RepID=A0ABQ1QV30_9RHOB|nr:thiol reductant ABC exporter subunit CydD [Sinisalibacter lacisalsi]GGD42792.1 thiol reductant ABC exporter subunit CydD [Sinisalibacter lacisalsi]
MPRRKPDPIARLTAPVRPALNRAAALAVVANLLWLVQAGAVAAAIGGALVPPALLSPAEGALVFLATGALRAGLGYVSGGIAFRASDRVIADLRARLLAREAGEGPATGVGIGGAGAVAALAGEKLDLLAPYLTRYAPARARVAVVPLVILAVAFSASWAVGLIFLISGPLIPVFMALVGMAAQDASERQMREVGTLNDLLADRLAALADFRLLGARPALIEGFAAQAEDLRARTMAVLRIAFLSSTVLELFAAIGVAMVAVFLGFSLLGAISFGTWGGPISPMAVIFLLMLAPEFYQPLRDLAAAWHDRAAAAAVAEELAAWEDAARAPGLGTGAAAAPLPGGFALTTRGVRLRRGETVIALPDITLGPGETLALTGPSGAGKTTALMALAGLLRPEAGEIRVNGQELDDSTADAWRAELGWMPQAPHFLDATLRDNVAMSAEGDVAAALEQAGVAHVVAALPEGVETRLGETGAGLSGGEARRVTLARALHARPRLLLADEPTADLDAETARIVTQALMARAKAGMALIVSTHDERLADLMDRAIKIGGAP